MTRVIVIDDEEDVRIVLRETLVRAGFEVEVASTGDEGLELMRQNKADLVVTDVVMPGKDGVATANDIRMEFPNTKIIVISGGGSGGIGGYAPEAIKTTAFLAAAAAVGADITMTKPFSREELVNVALALTSE
jgi:DNA-binding response OmpR family regulator